MTRRSPSRRSVDVEGDSDCESFSSKDRWVGPPQCPDSPTPSESRYLRPVMRSFFFHMGRKSPPPNVISRLDTFHMPHGSFRILSYREAREINEKAESVDKDAEELDSEGFAILKQRDSNSVLLHSISGVGSMKTSDGRSSRSTRRSTWNGLIEQLEFELRACRKRLSKKHPETLMRANVLALMQQDQGNLKEAEKLYRKLLTNCREVLGDRHPYTLASISNLGHCLVDRHWRMAQDMSPDGLEGLLKMREDELRQIYHLMSEAEFLMRNAIQGHRLGVGEGHCDTLHDINDLARFLMTQMRYAEAEVLFREAFAGFAAKCGYQHIHTLDAAGNLALVLRHLVRYQEAEDLLRLSFEGFPFRSGLLDFADDRTLQAASQLAECLLLNGRLDESLTLSRATLRSLQQTAGDYNVATLFSAATLANVLYSCGGSENMQEAEGLLSMCLQNTLEILGGRHPLYLHCGFSLAQLQQARGKREQAEKLHRSVLQGRHFSLGKGHRDALTSATAVAHLLQLDDKLIEAETLFREVHDSNVDQHGARHTDTLTSSWNLAGVLQAQGHFEGAERRYREVYEARCSQFGQDNPDTLRIASDLGVVLQKLGCARDETESLMRVALQRCRATLGSDHRTTLASIRNFAGVLAENGSDEEAAKLFNEAIAGMKQLWGPQHLETLEAEHVLAKLTLKMGRPEDAESLFNEVLSGRRAMLGNDHPDTMTTVRSISNLSVDARFSPRSTTEEEPVRQSFWSAPCFSWRGGACISCPMGGPKPELLVMQL